MVKKSQAEREHEAEVALAALEGIETTQRDALEGALAAIGKRLRDEHEAIVEAARGLARAVDEEPLIALLQGRSQNAALWKQYREAVEAVASIAASEEDDGQAALLKLVHPAVGDEADTGKKNTRTRARSRREQPRKSADAVATAGRRRRPRTTA